MKHCCIFFLLVVVSGVAHALDNGVGRTPAMGYNSWYDLGCSNEMNSKYILEVLDAFIKLGLSDYGYQYINLDDCWSGGRYADGTIYADTSRFPDGLVPIIKQVHSVGLKFGVYTDRGQLTCGGHPGAYGHEFQDAATFAAWGVDFLKEDSCNATQDHDAAFREYALMRDALNKTGRPIFFDLCGWYSWYAPVGDSLGNEWRIGPDDSNWPGILTNINIDAELTQYAGPGGWNNPCLLLANDVNGHPLVTELQSRAQFSMWSILAAPLVLSLNIRNLSDYLVETYTNIEVIDVDQDPLGRQGTRIYGGDMNPKATNAYNTTNIWIRPLHDGSWAAVFINAGATPATLQCNQQCFAEMNFYPPVTIYGRDLWEHRTVWISTGMLYTVTVPPNGGVNMMKFTAWEQ